MSRLVLAIVGPTASGKGALAAALADEFPLRLVSCDSRKVFKHMDVGTAKPPPPLRARFALMDVLAPDEPYSAGRFARDADAFIEDAFARSLVPTLVGGSVLYARAVLLGLFEEPRHDGVREEVREELRAHGTARLYAELLRRDPETASRVGPNDAQRIARAVEVVRASGRPMSALQRESPQRPRYPYLLVSPQLAATELKERIAGRTRRMFESGLLEETRALVGMGYRDSVPMKTVGYREAVACVDGALTRDEAERRVVAATWQLARKQRRFVRSLGAPVSLESARERLSSP